MHQAQLHLPPRSADQDRAHSTPLPTEGDIVTPRMPMLQLGGGIAMLMVGFAGAIWLRAPRSPQRAATRIASSGREGKERGGRCTTRSRSKVASVKESKGAAGKRPGTQKLRPAVSDDEEDEDEEDGVDVNDGDPWSQSPRRELVTSKRASKSDASQRKADPACRASAASKKGKVRAYRSDRKRSEELDSVLERTKATADEDDEDFHVL